METETSVVAAPIVEPATAVVERLWRSYGVINEWIRFADAKAGALLTFNGVVFGAALSVLSAHREHLARNSLAFCLAVSFGACLVLSAICALECIKPRVRLKLGSGKAAQKKADPKVAPAKVEAAIKADSETDKCSLIYFEEIAAWADERAFRVAVLDASTVDDAFKDISKQVYLVSKVASIKHQWIARSVFSLHASVFFGLILLWALYTAPDTSVVAGAPRPTGKPTTTPAVTGAPQVTKTPKPTKTPKLPGGKP